MRGEDLFWTFCISSVVGILLVLSSDIFAALINLLLFLSFLFTIIFWKVWHKQLFIFFAIILLGASFGIWRADSDITLTNDLLNQSLEQTVSLNGIIDNAPDYRENNVKLEIALDDYDTKLLASTEAYGEYNYGDHVVVNGKLELPQNFTGETGREFDYISYLALSDIGYLMRFAQVDVNSAGHGNVIYSTLFSLRERLVASIARIISEPESSLLAGELLGEKSALSAETNRDLRATGLIHIVVLSGYNVTIIAAFLVRTLRRLPRRVSLSIAMLSIVAFVIMVGAGATIVRAGTMAIAMIFASMIGRDYSVMRTLLLVGYGMIVFEPKIILHDISFQLSFAATLGLLLFSPWFAARLDFLTEKLEIRNNAAAVLATQFAVLPLLVRSVGEISIIAPLANIAVLFMVPVSMLTGFLAGLAGWFSQILAQILAIPAYLTLLYQTKLIEFFANIPHASVVIPQGLEFGILAIWFICLIIIIRSQEFSWSGSDLDGHPMSGAIHADREQRR